MRPYRMVLDSGLQTYDRSSSSTIKDRETRLKTKITQINNVHSYSCSAISQAPQPPRSRPKSFISTNKTHLPVKTEPRKMAGCPVYMGQCSWMRRSESSCTINSSGSSSQSRIKSSGSLPHISRPSSVPRVTKRSSCLLVALRPTNVDQEREKFFSSKYTYNPQFLYQEPMPTSVLEKYNEASDQFLTQAIRILNAVLQKYGSYENFESVTGGNLLSKCQIWASCRKYMQKEGCAGEVVVQLSEDLLSQAVMTVENSRPTLTINLLGARQHWLEGMLRHEIGTHYLRGVNDAHQPWHKSEGRKQFGLKPANPTEEGLASLHSVLYRKHPYLWRAALLYYTVSRAANTSFCELFHDLHQFVQDPVVRWEYCVRAKRGQQDTGQPGCFSKDQVYLDGIVRILRHRNTIDFPLLTSLGKVSFEDVEGLRPFAELENTRIPHFMQDLDKYHHQLCHIMETNQLTDEELICLLAN
ncbi:microtubule-associated tyrosine carboxypeptidase 1 [Bombina bombina]|uniref:microtubule-associated tyrosine carboxypeptidase 1 n=1 Tax=Bombina bombina TaxID=8345 RepID=UPI00235B2B58|nr:microtubule-associated tyrosine carboxypeptidase 1 [Bombina bombina]